MQHDDSDPLPHQRIKPIGFDQPGGGEATTPKEPLTESSDTTVPVVSSPDDDSETNLDELGDAIKPIGFDQNGGGLPAEDGKAPVLPPGY